jgi:peptidyl-prolyl cis-trans isomerase A (cyclophilin A)
LHGCFERPPAARAANHFAVNLIAAALSLALAAQPTSPPTDPALLHPAALAAKAPAQYDVSFKTTKGTFVVAVTRSWSPHGADRFYNLVKHGFFNGAAFFRVVPGFIIQFGLSPSPAVNAAWSGANIKDDSVKTSNHAGYLSFASAGPNSRTTQVFVNLGDNARLDGMGFSPFGKVVSGMNVVTKIYAGYGESPDQGAITAQGKTYLEKNFPSLDRIVSAKVAPAASSAPAHH